MTKIIVSVISDLVTDQRVHKVSQTLYEQGFDVFLVGTKKKSSLHLDSRNYKTKRISVFFQRGFLFYAEWNIRLFIFLLTHKAQILLANDLDTLLPNYFISKLKKNVLVYDTHEYFTEAAEIYKRKFVKNVWVKIENYLFPKLKYIYTVNNSIANLYAKKFDKQVLVIRNVPLLKKHTNVSGENIFANLKLPQNKRILLMQGTGFNENRGLEELVLAGALIPEDCIIVFAGTGLIIDKLKELAKKNNLQKKVFFTGVLPFNQLHFLTQKAFCGFSIDQPFNLNQQVSLPNKIFDYFAEGVPVIASNIKEVAHIINQYKVGLIINEVTHNKINEAVTTFINDKNLYNTCKTNTTLAIKELNWDNEKIILVNLFNQIVTENNLSVG